jgi:hypothetical protein
VKGWITNKDVIEVAFKLKGYQLGDVFRCNHPSCNAPDAGHYFLAWEDDLLVISETLGGSKWGHLEMEHIAAWKPCKSEESE